MLPKQKRINLSKEFKWVATGKRKETPLLTCFYKEGENSFARIGIALKKATFKKAHDRNRAKREVSQCIQILYPTLRNNLNLVIMPKLGILNKSIQEVTDELKSIKDLYSND